MLPPFYVRNLWPPSLPKASQDYLVRINPPCYDETILTHPTATLKYYDEDDGDLITLGSSQELTDKLEEPVSPPSSRLSANSQHDHKFSEYHVFEIDDRACVKKLWQALQSSSKDSERVSRVQSSGGAVEWSVERKNRLAILYERRKAEIWSSIAEELGVSSESVDAMHWILGREEIARRAHQCNPRPEQSRNLEEPSETEPDSTHNATSTQHFEDYRVHHFNATMPPQVQLSMPVSAQMVQKARPASIPKVSKVNLDRSASSVMNRIEEARIAKEGKEQARAGGGILRPRMVAVDKYQNRWPSHEVSTSTFFPAPTSPSPAFDGPGLTSEGKRQAQVAGDKLRWRTNPIRHSRPSRAGASEHAISKNRWSSYSGTRAARFDEKENASDQPEDAPDTSYEKEVPKNRPKSLLEVFEAELAKKISATNTEEGLGLESPAVQNSVPEPAVQINHSSESQAQSSPRGSQALLGLIHELAAGNVALSQDFSTVIDHGIRGLGTCMQSIARGLQEVSSVPRQAADRTRNADSQLIDHAVLGLQNLAGDFFAALGGQMATNRSGITSPPRSETEEVEAGSSSATAVISDAKNQEEDTKTALKSNHNPSNDVDNPSKMVYDLGPNHVSPQWYNSEKPASPQPEVASQASPSAAMSEESRCHHLSGRPGYVDHLRQSQSVKLFDEQYDIQRSRSPPLDTRFPTLAQFEGQNFGATPTFPPLPNMQPLVSQRASCHHKYGTKAETSGAVTEWLPLVSRSNSTEGSGQSHDAAIFRHQNCVQRDEHKVKPVTRQSSAARLAEPFDPLEAEPSARPNLTEGLRRNATIASTDIRRRRRPYSEVFDGSGRVPWGSFLQDNVGERRGLHRASEDRGRPLGTDREHPKRLSRPEARSRCSPPAAASGYDDQHHDDSTVGKINDCVERLRDLGFGGEDNDSAGRLLVYAQAADGVLVDAIDLIDEEQRAWQRL